MNELFLVIGGNNTIGINVVKELLKLKKKIRVLVSNKFDIDGVDVHKGSLEDENVSRDFFAKDKKTITYVINCIQNKKLALFASHLCSLHKVDKYVYISSEISDLVITSNVNTTAVLPSYIMGPGEFKNNIINDYLLKLKKSELKKFVNEEINIIDVRDVAKGIIYAAFYGKDKVVYNLINKNYYIKDICDSFSEICQCKKIKKYYTVEMLMKKEKIMRKLCEIKKTTPLYDIETLSNLSKYNNLSLNTTIKDLEFNCRSLLVTLKDTNEYFNARYN